MACTMKKMKITNPQQYEAMLSHMEKFPDLAKGYLNTSEAKVNSKNLWEEITKECNAYGPPIRNNEGWKKVWSDFKFFIKKKLRHNKKQHEGTGGGPYKKFSFSPIESKVIDLLNLHSAVNGINGAKTFGSLNIANTNTQNIEQRSNVEFSEQMENSQSERTEEQYCSQNLAEQQNPNSYPEEDCVNTTATTRKRKSAKSRDNQGNSYNLLKEQTTAQKELFAEISKTLNTIKANSRRHSHLLAKIVEIEEAKLEIKKAKLQMTKDEIIRKTRVKITEERGVIQDIELKRRKLDLLQSQLLIQERMAKCNCRK